MTHPLPGWFWPSDSRRAHWMVEGRSLCGKWAIFGTYPLSTDPDTEPCKSCLRKLAEENTNA